MRATVYPKTRESGETGATRLEDAGGGMGSVKE